MPVPLDSLFSFGFVTLLRLGCMVVVVTTLLPVASNGEGESVDLLGDGDNPTGPMVVVTTLLPIAIVETLKRFLDMNKLCNRFRVLLNDMHSCH